MTDFQSPFGLITGTGADLLDDLGIQFKEQVVVTPFGDAWLQRCEWCGVKFWHLNRHLSTAPLAEQDFRLPHDIDPRRNMWALGSLGVREIRATSAVGSINGRMKLGHVVMVDQMRTPDFGILTFAELELTPMYGPGVYGPRFFRENGEPVCGRARHSFFEACRPHFKMGSVHRTGNLSIVRGPTFETNLDVDILRNLGIDVLGMGTALPEAYLAKEIGICYAGAFIVTDDPSEAPEQDAIVAVAREIAPTVITAAVDDFRGAVGHEGCFCGRPEVSGLREAFGWEAS